MQTFLHTNKMKRVFFGSTGGQCRLESRRKTNRIPPPSLPASSQQHYWRQHWPCMCLCLCSSSCCAKKQESQSGQKKDGLCISLSIESSVWKAPFDSVHSTTFNESTMKLMNWREPPAVSIIHFHIYKSRPAPTILTRLFFKRGIQR